MADTTTPITPPAQDLQINLDDSPKSEETKQVESVLPAQESEPATGSDLSQPSTNLDLNLDLNISDTPKDDNRLHEEDKKNLETTTNKETNVNEKSSETTETKISEPTTGNLQPETGNNLQQSETTGINSLESSVNSLESSANSPESSSLEKDKKIIDALEGHSSAGGLAPEATVVQQPVITEAPKTFDLDAMLGNPIIAPTTKKQPSTGNNLLESVSPSSGIIGVPLPAFTVPTSAPQAPTQVILQTKIPVKMSGIKVLFFITAFAALGFTTFFILKTMYPIEFGNLFAGNNTQTHTSASIDTGEQISGDVEIISTDTGAVTDTGTDTSLSTLDTSVGTGSSGDNLFGDLNNLPTQEEAPATDISRLTDYVSQGTNFLVQGKAIGNSTVIKYGLYISKKATAFLEDIANGKEITNLTGYFAQFDTYITQLQNIVGTNISSSSSGNDITGSTDTTSGNTSTSE